MAPTAQMHRHRLLRRQPPHLIERALHARHQTIRALHHLLPQPLLLAELGVVPLEVHVRRDAQPAQRDARRDHETRHLRRRRPRGVVPLLRELLLRLCLRLLELELRGAARTGRGVPRGRVRPARRVRP